MPREIDDLRLRRSCCPSSRPAVVLTFLGEDDTESGGCEPLSSSRIESSDATDNDRPCSYASQVGTDFDRWLITEEFEVCQDESIRSPYEAALENDLTT